MLIPAKRRGPALDGADEVGLGAAALELAGALADAEGADDAAAPGMHWE